MTDTDDPWSRMTIIHDPKDLEEIVTRLYRDPAVRVADIPARVNAIMTERGDPFRLSTRSMQRVLRVLHAERRIPAVKPHRR